MEDFWLDSAGRYTFLRCEVSTKCVSNCCVCLFVLQKRCRPQAFFPQESAGFGQGEFRVCRRDDFNLYRYYYCTGFSSTGLIPVV